MVEGGSDGARGAPAPVLLRERDFPENRERLETKGAAFAPLSLPPRPRSLRRLGGHLTDRRGV